MKYPRLPKVADKRTVLMEWEISEMIDLRNRGFSSRRIGAMYSVSKTIVLYHTNDDAYREKVNKKRYSLVKQRVKVDKNYKSKRSEQKKASIKSILKRSEPHRKFKGKATYKWKKKKRATDPEFKKKDNEQSLKSYHKTKLP